MGAICVNFFVFFLCYLFICISAYPVTDQGSNGDDNPSSEPAFKAWTLLVALSFTVSCVLLVFGCLNCCKQRSGFKEFRNSDTNENSVGLDFVNPLPNVGQPSRYSIFSSIAAASSDTQPESIVTFEPLPRVLPNKNSAVINIHDAAFLQDWLRDKDFPRQQLHYVKECGQGWFGKVVEGEARGILPSSNKVHKVIVRILKEDATNAEQAFFLQEAKPFRDLAHPNILKLLGKSLDNVPFLLVFETCSNGDLKSYLKQNVANRELLVNQGIILKMAVDVAAGLSYMLQNGFVHTDIAVRNCLVTGDLRIKVGDYGTNLQAYKDEYYFNGDMALPIRWCAPETLNCTETTIEPKQVTGASCIWSYGVLLWELEEWAELPYKELTDHQVISQVFCGGLRLQCPEMRTPYTQEMYAVMAECWKDYVDRPSFIHVLNSLSAVLHKFKSNSFDARWHSSKPNCIPVADNDDKMQSRVSALSGKCDNDSGIDLHNPKSRISALQFQQSSSRQRSSTDDCSSDSPASSRRFSNSSTADLFPSPVSLKMRSPSLENLHGSASSLNRRCRGDMFDDVASGSPRFGKVDFKLGLVSSGDSSILWNNKPLFQSDSYLEDASIMRRIESLSVDPEEDVWRKRIERGEFTEKVKEKSKSVADLMVLTHIDCSESSESDSLPSFHSRQSSFNRQCRRINSKAATSAAAAGGPISLLNSLSFGSESNLPIVETDQQFQETLKKIHTAKVSGNEESLDLSSLAVGKEEARNTASGPFLVNEASEPRTKEEDRFSSHYQSVAASEPKLPVLLFDCNVFETRSPARQHHFGATNSVGEELNSLPSSGSSENLDSVVIGPSENDTLEFFKGLKTTLVEKEMPEDKEERELQAHSNEEDDHSPRTLNEFLNDRDEEYFYKCTNEEAVMNSKNLPNSYCDFCYNKCHFSNECLRSIDENCSCESFENLEKFRDCTAFNSCPFQSDDSGRGTDQINSGEGSGEKSLEGSISVQMNELKHRLEDVVAKFTTEEDEEASENNCSSLEEDKDEKEMAVIEEISDEVVEEADGGASSQKDLQSEDDESTSADDDTCLDTVIDSTMSIRSPENEDIKSESMSEDNRNNESRTFVKVEQLFFSVDPKFEKEIKTELSRTFDSIPKCRNSIEDLNVEAANQGEVSNENEVKEKINEDFRSEDSINEKSVSYELTDILEGLCEPISLPYSVNDEAEVGEAERIEDEEENEKMDEEISGIPDSWLPMSIESDDDDGDEVGLGRRSLEMDESFLNAIRNELMQKLPNSSTMAVVEAEEQNLEEVTSVTTMSTMTVDYNSYPAQLSPILEEDEYSSISPVQSVASSETSVGQTFDNSSCLFDGENDDLLVVDVETNRASILELEGKTSSTSSLIKRHRLNETYDIDENDDTIGASDTIDSDSLPSPDSLSPASSSKTGAHLSYSSSECGNLSDVFLSPSGSSKNFEDFELDKSPDDSRLLNTPENSSQYQKVLFSMDELLQNGRSDDITFLHSPPAVEQNQLGRSQSEHWLRALFSPPAADGCQTPAEHHHQCYSLPVDLESACWRKIEDTSSEPNTVTNSPTSELGAQRSTLALEADDEKSDTEADRTLTLEVIPRSERVDIEPAMAEKVYVSENEMSSSESSRSGSLRERDEAAKAIEAAEQGSSNQDAKVKNSIALFGNANKQIRNFQVSVVQDDCYLNNKSSSSPKVRRAASDAYWSERFAVATSQDSEKTWKSPSNSYLGSPNMEVVENQVVNNMNDLFMSTSFIENDSRDGSVDENHQMRSDESDEEGLESTSEEFVWKETDSIAQNNKKTDIDDDNDDDDGHDDDDDDNEDDDDDDDDDDDEELPEFVPFSWNFEAVPQKSALKAKDKIVTQKKNVSFKKQKYHCVYEYPKEEPNYARIYDNIVQERMLNLWSVDRDYLYNIDYLSFSDWELEDCGGGGDEQQNNEEILPYNSNVSAVPRANLSNKLGFYTIGVYDLDNAAKTEDDVVVNDAETCNSSNAACVSQEKCENSYLSSNSSSQPEIITDDQSDKTDASLQNEHTSSLILGELKHTKNRLKLDLNSPVTSYKSSLESKSYDRLKAEKSDSDEESREGGTSSEELLDDKFVADYGLNFKSCDISPVVELQSLASTSVA